MTFNLEILHFLNSLLSHLKESIVTSLNHLLKVGDFKSTKFIWNKQL